MDFFSWPPVEYLRSLALPADDFAIAGSGPLAVRGWIDDPTDLDVVARGAAWERACELGDTEPAPYGDTRRVLLAGGTVEILNGWFPMHWKTDEIIDNADVINGMRFVVLPVVAATKQMLFSPRNARHLAVLAGHGAGPAAGGQPSARGQESRGMISSANRCNGA